MKKTMSFLRYTLCVAAISLTVIACKKGDTGPAGATGAQGPQGAPGAQGPQGPAGTANVIYSPWIDTAQWIADTVDNGGTIDTLGFFTFLDAPKLDLNILNTGEIKVYANFSSDRNDPLVLAVPYLGNFYIDDLFWLNTIQLSSNVDFTGTGVAFRYVLIPGGTTARTANGKVIDWNNYAEVQKYLGFKD